MDLETAYKYFEKIFEARKNSEFPFPEDGDEKFRKHCLCTADNARKIASRTAYLNPEKAYIFGLLHDYGRIKDEFNGEGYHGLVGYIEMNKEGYPDIAKICLSHCFFDRAVDISHLPMEKEMLEESFELYKTLELDDYDLLIQLVDLTNKFGKSCTIDERIKDVCARYNVSRETLKPSIDKIKEIKTYFDKICGQDTYEIIGIKDEDTRF